MHYSRVLGICFSALVSFAVAASAQAPSLLPTYKDIDYAPAEPAGTNGHKLDLYQPSNPGHPVPLVIWTRGSAWLQDNGRDGAGRLAAQLNPEGYAVAGVSIRSSAQTRFPGQLYDIKAAIRYLRANAAKYNIDPNHIGIIGDSSGGWTSLMAAVTGDAPQMEGDVGVTGPSSAVQVAVAFYPPTNFLIMDAWALRKCGLPGASCHDAADSPESKLVGCAIQTCPDRVHAADPHAYLTGRDPPIMVFHGGSDALVPHNQGESFYMALNKACHDAVFISLPRAGHGGWFNFLASDELREAAVMRSTASQDCTVTNPVPYTPSWKTLIDFLDKYLKT